MQSRLASALSFLGREALRIVLPSWCAACGEELPWTDRTASCCTPCWTSLPRIDRSKCSSCALPSAVEGEAGLCLDCRADPLPLEWCDAWGEYRGGLERLIIAMKFRRHDFLDDALASLIEETLRTRGDLAFDAIVGVPMSAARERARGYNQTELLGRALSRRIGVPATMSMLVRQGEQQMQSTLPKRERAANLRGAFRGTAAAAGKTVLIVDDVCTTGETLRACAGALVHAGVARVCAVTVARAI